MGIVDFARRYDGAIFDAGTRALYDGSDFFNLGDWSEHPAGPPRGLGEAARRLVARHLAVDAPQSAAAARVVLDVGCGLGPATRMMARHYPAALVLGINISAVQLAHAARTSPSTAPSTARFAAMDAARLAIAAGSVDRIHAIEAAFHFNTRLDFLCEAHRVLRPGGKLALSDILYRRRFADVPEDNHWIDAGDYQARCASAGFVVESFQDLTHCTVEPFFTYLAANLAANRKRAQARVWRRAIAAYCYVVLRRPGPSPS